MSSMVGVLDTTHGRVEMQKKQQSWGEFWKMYLAVVIFFGLLLFFASIGAWGPANN